MRNNNLKRKMKEIKKKAKVVLVSGLKLGLSFIQKVFKAFYNDWLLPFYNEVLPFIAIFIIATVCKEYNIFWNDDLKIIVILFILLRRQRE